MHLAENIDLVSAVAGGLIIGITSSGYLYLTGRVSGLSGIMESLLVSHDDDQKRWTSAYVIGLLSSGAILNSVYPIALAPVKSMPVTTLGIMISGFLVGLGTRMGNGCTSGHGICGLSRLSPRSLAAVLTFMTTGAIGSYLVKETSLNEVFFSNSVNHVDIDPSYTVGISVLIILLSTYPKDILAVLSGSKMNTVIQTIKENFRDYLITFTSAMIFGLGLGVSGMLNPSRVIQFLNFSGSEGWDPSLMGVMGSGVVFNTIVRTTLASRCGKDRPCSGQTTGKTFSDIVKVGLEPVNLKVDSRLIIGSAIFGFAWGLTGICPGPGVVSMGGGSSSAIYFVSSMMAGMFAWRSFNY
eukprot:gene919-1782_t